MSDTITTIFFPYAKALSNGIVPYNVAHADTLQLLPKKIELTTSIFLNHELQNTNNFNLLEKSINQTPLLSIYLLITLLITSLISQLYLKRFQIVLNAPWQSRFYNQINTESKLFDHPLNFILFFLYSANLAIFTFLLLSSFQVHLFPDDSTYLELLLLFLVILGASFIKNILAKITAFLFKQSDFASIYTAQIHLSQNNLGIYLLPILWIMMYHPITGIYQLMVAVILLFGGLRLVKTIYNLAYSTRLSLYQIFLYLCTVEILPLIVLAKYISKNV